MNPEVAGMLLAGAVALLTGVALAWRRMRAACGAARFLILGPVFEATALAMFAAEHFLAARDLMPIVPRWLPAPLFWTYFFGAALLAAAISFIIRRGVRWSASLLALFFVLVVVTLDLPSLPKHLHERIFWTLTVRELSFAGGAMVLAGNVWPPAEATGAALRLVGRVVVALVLIFYASQHFLFPHFAPGVPLELMTPSWVPSPVLLAYLTGFVLLLGGVALLSPSLARTAGAGAGGFLVLLTALFYVPIFLLERHTQLAVEGLNYVGDTLLFAATVMLSGDAPPGR